MQTEDITNMSRRVREMSVELDIKNEKRNRATISELHVPRTMEWSSIKIVDDPSSKWKNPRSKYRRQALDYSLLDHVGVLGPKSGPDHNTRRVSVGESQAGLKYFMIKYFLCFRISHILPRHHQGSYIKHFNLSVRV